MDDRDQPGTNVVNLRRKNDPNARRRKDLASTIFADEDEIGPFSQGNLVPPRATTPRRDEDSAAREDPFFDRYQQKSSDQTALDAASPAEVDGTEEYFNEMSTRTPIELAASVRESAPMSAMPGSARLPADLRKAVSPARARRIAAANARRLSSRGRRRRVRSLALSVGALIAIAVGILTQIQMGSEPLRANRSAADVAPFGRLLPAVLSALDKPFGERYARPQPRNEHTQLARPNRALRKQPKARIAFRPTPTRPHPRPPAHARALAPEPMASPHAAPRRHTSPVQSVSSPATTRASSPPDAAPSTNTITATGSGTSRRSTGQASGNSTAARGASQAAGPSGPVSLVGAGTTPSG